MEISWQNEAIEIVIMYAPDRRTRQKLLLLREAIGGADPCRGKVLSTVPYSIARHARLI